MEQVTFKTLEAEKVHKKLLDAANRIMVIQELIDKVWNTADTCGVLPILQDAQDDLADVYSDMTEWQGNKLEIINK